VLRPEELDDLPFLDKLKFTSHECDVIKDHTRWQIKIVLKSAQVIRYSFVVMWIFSEWIFMVFFTVVTADVN